MPYWPPNHLEYKWNKHFLSFFVPRKLTALHTLLYGNIYLHFLLPRRTVIANGSFTGAKSPLIRNWVQSRNCPVVGKISPTEINPEGFALPTGQNIIWCSTCEKINLLECGDIFNSTRATHVWIKSSICAFIFLKLHVGNEILLNKHENMPRKPESNGAYFQFQMP